jgi:hypothetical protein
VLGGGLGSGGGFAGFGARHENFFDWLEVEQKVPDFTTVRTWMTRLGVAALEEPIERADDWIWMLDHSNQIGQEKVLLVLGIRASKLPEPGTALKHADMRVLHIQLGTQWKREDMQKVYAELSARYGPPRAVLVDGAVELRDGALPLKNQREDSIVLRDFKHFAANAMQSLIGKDPRFVEFLSQAGRTRSAIQQTELAHLTPPSSKPKSRFMNLAATLCWAGVVSWLLNNPDAKSRQSLDADRLESKLGWLRDYTAELAAWQECQNVISLSVSFLNEHGLFWGVGTCLSSLIGESLNHPLSRQLAQRLIEFVRGTEEQLREGERLPISTEILESSFGLYKQLEGQHSKGGFTSLLPALGALLQPTTPERVRAAFSRVKNKDVKTWVEKKLGETLTSRRRSTYAEYKSATKTQTTT